MPIEPENTAESSPEAEERPLAPVDEIMAVKGIEEPTRAVEEAENETQDEPEVVAEEAEEETAEDVAADSDDEVTEADGGGDSEDDGLVEEVPDGPVNTAPEVEEPTTSYYGTCRITFYCSCSACCGQYAGGPTASGAMPTAGWTVANGSLPFGAQVVIDGHTYCVEDRGVSGDQFDIYVDSHDEALQRGLYYADVYLVG